jgi:hypothetical protein
VGKICVVSAVSLFGKFFSVEYIEGADFLMMFCWVVFAGVVGAV